MALLILEESRTVDPLVREVRYRMVRSDQDRGQHRQQLRLEEVVHELQLARVQLLHLDVLDAAAAELLHHGAVDLFLHREESGDHLIDVVKLLLRRPAALIIAVVRCHTREVEDAAHTHHEKLVQIAGENRDELEALQCRHRWVGGLLEHALVKAQPA